VWQALTAAASRRVKLELGLSLGDRIADAQLALCLQQRDLHRRFSISCFPDAGGDFYDVELAILRLGRLGLFDWDASEGEGGSSAE
jgi:hypothetical protein